MEEINLVSEALKFMFLGIGVVFTFLVLLIYILKLQAWIITRYFHKEEVILAKEWQPDSKEDNNTLKIAAIVAAVQHHKNNQR
ncbi:MAG: OadG family protein [Arcobacteraceae bacterium]|jgi:oxaloacetate decarboxylase gamma subunit|nr:OadG family protein [Arcobacteraceae bacterium]